MKPSKNLRRAIYIRTKLSDEISILRELGDWLQTSWLMILRKYCRRRRNRLKKND